MDLKGKRIILGSASPRRRELLAGLDIDFTVDTGNTYIEDLSAAGVPEEIPSIMAKGKSYGFHRPLEADEILITADTVVIIDGKVLGKPHDRADAIRMLKELSDKEHKVVTAVTMRSLSHEVSFSDETLVQFMHLSEEEIQFYVDRYKPFDKAGAYGVQEWIGYVGIKGIKGSFYTVMGFPVHKVYSEIKLFLSLG